ncbi:MAG TPA: T3SS effector HopA1 family protein [Bryobacteraceae bacterium]|jgi:hypothetical protein|nr:T3SS effector HopA1 family protein [Bryobacteraceae bacterium]
MTALRSELARIVEAAAFVSPAAFVFAGQPSSGQLAPVAGVTLSPEMPPVVMELMTRLYESCYSRRFEGSVAPLAAPQSPDDPEWVESLSRANRSRERWENGWQVVASLPSGQWLARRGSLTRALWPGEFLRRDAPGAPVSPGALVSVYFPRESRAMQPGFYFVFGETPADVFDDFALVRFYWNVRPEGGAALVESLSTSLNRWFIPFRFKILNHRGAFTRLDAAILYAPRRYARVVLELCSEIRQRIQTALGEETPLFTLRLAAGLGFAEDPGITESFGMSRCRLLAEAIWLAHSRGATRTDDRMRIIEEHFGAHGIDLDRPWLNPGSAPPFEFTESEARAA